MLAQVLLRFDGSLAANGRAGGAGAGLSWQGAVIWEGARFAPALPTSAAAEYEGLILGLTAARNMV